MKPIPQMLTDETLRSRYREAIRRKSVLSPRSTIAGGLEREIADTVAELEEEIADLVQEQRRRGLHVDPDELQKPAPVPCDPAKDDLRTLTNDELRERLLEACKNFCCTSPRSKIGRQIKRDMAGLEEEFRRRGLPIPIDRKGTPLK